MSLWEWDWDLVRLEGRWWCHCCVGFLGMEIGGGGGEEEEGDGVVEWKEWEWRVGIWEGRLQLFL